VLEDPEAVNLVLFENPNYFQTVKYRIEAKNETSVRMTISNSVGQEIFKKDIELKGFLEDEISMSNQPSGVYYLSLKSDKATVAKKVVLVNE
jgi:hypothetical protein